MFTLTLASTFATAAPDIAVRTTAASDGSRNTCVSIARQIFSFQRSDFFIAEDVVNQLPV